MGIWHRKRRSALLPPFSQVGGTYQGRLEALSNIWSFVEHTRAKYVVLSNCDVITTIDFNDALEHHQTSGADITFIYGKGIYLAGLLPHNAAAFSIDETCHFRSSRNPLLSGECNISRILFIMNTTRPQQSEPYKG